MANTEKMGIDSSTQVFTLPIEITSEGTYTRKLHTADTYVDKDIEVKVTVPDATYKTISTGSVTLNAGVVANNYTTETNTGYSFDVTADGEISDVKIGIDQAGFATADDVITIEGSAGTQNTKTVYLKDGAIQATNATATSVGGNGVTLTATATVPSSGYYITTTGSADASVKTEGWVNSTNDTAVTATKTQYYTMASAELNNVAGDVADADYATLTTPVLTEGGNLYITEGYIQNTKISLADLVPDNANITSANAELVYKTVKAYNSDGALIVGTMTDSTVTITPSAENTVTNATATSENTVTGSDGVTPVTYATAADAGDSYVKISNNVSTVDGSLSNSVSVSVTKGYASGDEGDSVDVSGSVSVTSTNAADKYFKVYVPVVGEDTLEWQCPLCGTNLIIFSPVECSAHAVVCPKNPYN